MQVDLTLASFISILISFVLPLGVGLVTKMNTHAGVKAVLLLLAVTLNSFLSEGLAALQNHNADFSWTTAALTAMLGFAMAVAAHFGLYKPTGAAQAVAVRGVTNRHPSPYPHDGGYADLLILAIVLLVVAAIFGGIFIHPLLLLLLIIVVVALYVGRGNTRV